MLRCQWFESDSDVTIRISGTPPSTTATSTTPMSVVGSEGEETKSVEPGLTAAIQTPVVESDLSGPRLSSTLLSASPSLATPSAPEVPLDPPLILADVVSLQSVVQATVTASASTPAAHDVNSASGPVDNTSSFSLPAPVVDLASSAATVINSASFPSSPTPAAPVVNSASVPVSSHETDTKASSMDVYSDVDDEKAAKDKPRLGPQSVVPAYDKSVLPAWLIKTAMLDYLHGISQEKAWQDLVTTLMKFEIVNTMTGVSTVLFIVVFLLNIVS